MRLREWEGEEQRRSFQGELRARPAGRGTRCGVPFQVMGVWVLWRWRRKRERERARLPPALSPDRMMWLGGTAVWRTSGGGNRRFRYATRQSRRAAGKGFCGASR